MGNEVKEKEKHFQMQKGRLLFINFYKYLKTKRKLYYIEQPSIELKEHSWLIDSSDAACHLERLCMYIFMGRMVFL